MCDNEQMENPGLIPVIEKNENIDLLLNEISKFDTDGYDVYDIQGFREKILNKGIDPRKVIDQSLQSIVLKENDAFSEREIELYNAMRAWLHCDFENATEYIRNNFDFSCDSDESFLKKFVFLRFVSVLIFENLTVDEIAAAQTPIVSNERSVFKELKNAVLNGKGSFLLNYFAQDFVDVIDGKRNSVQGDKMDYKPFLISPNTFAFDRKSAFVMVSKHTFKDDGIYITKPNSVEDISESINSLEDNKFMTQEDFNNITKNFVPISEVYTFSDIDLNIYRKLQSPYHRERIFEKTGIDLKQLPINEQLYFLDYLKFCDSEKLKQVQDFYSVYNKKGLKTFLSVEHGGKEMGDKILHLSENLPENEAKEIFNGYGSLIDNTNLLGNKISKHIETAIESNKIPAGVDIAKLPNQLMNALMLRAKDVLVGADNVLENQLSGAEEKLNTKDVTDAVLGINTLVSMLSDVDSGSEYAYKKLDSFGNKPGEYLTKYLVSDNIGTQYDLKIFIRPKAEKNAQARVNIELSFDTEKPNERLQKAFYNETVNHKENKTSAGSVLRIGIDRDDFNYNNAVSLDLGRSERETEVYTRSGDVLGKLLSMTSIEGHHETTAFSKEFADPEVFAQITTMLAGYFANLKTS